MTSLLNNNSVLCYFFSSDSWVNHTATILEAQGQMMTTPLPNKPVRGSQSGVAIMAVFDLLGRKWNMRILWELRRDALSFRGLQQACDDMSPSVLNGRLKQLATAELLQATADGYTLTALGQSLMQTLDPLRDWADVWQQTLAKDN